VPVVGDSSDEPDETFTANLSDPANAEIADAQATGTIVNDDTAISIDDVSVAEGNSGTTNAVFTVSLAHASTLQITVTYATADGTATQPGDYTATAGSLSFDPGETQKTISVPVAGDRLDEPNEAFAVNLASPVNGKLADSQGIGTITDDDRNGSFSCQAQALRVGDTIYGTANPPNAPCMDDSSVLPLVTRGLLGLSLNASGLEASTEQQPDDLDLAPAVGDHARADAGLTAITIKRLTARVTITGIRASASASCEAAADGLSPVLTSDSAVGSVTVGNGQPIDIGTTRTSLNIVGLGVLHLNDPATTTSDGGGGEIVRRAVWLDRPSGADVFAGEARAGVAGNPCAA
jgi:hypothetical protein